MLGLNDTVIIKSKVQTSDGRGGVTTALTTKIASLICSIQPIRREELRIEHQGMVVTDPNILMYENIISGPAPAEGDIVVHGSDQYLIINVASTSGKGTHTEAILKQVDGDAAIS